MWSACLRRLLSPWRSDKARQHHLGEDGARDAGLLRQRLMIIAAIDDDDEIDLPESEQELPAPAAPAHPMIDKRRAAGGEVAHVPMIAIAARAIDGDHRRRHARYPLRRDDA